MDKKLEIRKYLVPKGISTATSTGSNISTNKKSSEQGNNTSTNTSNTNLNSIAPIISTSTIESLSNSTVKTKEPIDDLGSLTSGACCTKVYKLLNSY